jgi:threonine dehydrogenase-like Zn-dependent dehydrogenase
MTSRWSKDRRLELAKRVAARIRPSKYITHRFPLDHAAAAFDLLATADESVLQIVLEP